MPMELNSCIFPTYVHRLDTEVTSFNLTFSVNHSIYMNILTNILITTQVSTSLIYIRANNRSIEFMQTWTNKVIDSKLRNERDALSTAWLRENTVRSDSCNHHHYISNGAMNSNHTPRTTSSYTIHANNQHINRHEQHKMVRFCRFNEFLHQNAMMELTCSERESSR